MLQWLVFSSEKVLWSNTNEICSNCKRSIRNSDGHWRETTPCLVSWWVVKGPKRKSAQLAACLALSLLTALFFWELPRNRSWGEMTVVVLVWEQLRWLVHVQARKSAAERGKLWPLSCHGTLTAGWKHYTSLPLFSSPLSFFLFCGRVGVSRRNTLPTATSQGLPCGLGLTGRFTCFHSASRDINSTHDRKL